VLTAVWVLAPSRAGIERRARTMAKSHIRRLRQAAVAWAAAHGMRYAVVQVDVFGLTRDGQPVHVKAVS
jgi:Holliday junction resolvase-like predicted endonuclease